MARSNIAAFDDVIRRSVETARSKRAFVSYPVSLWRFRHRRFKSLESGTIVRLNLFSIVSCDPRVFQLRVASYVLLYTRFEIHTIHISSSE